MIRVKYAKSQTSVILSPQFRYDITGRGPAIDTREHRHVCRPKRILKSKPPPGRTAIAWPNHLLPPLVFFFAISWHRNAAVSSPLETLKAYQALGTTRRPDVPGMVSQVSPQPDKPRQIPQHSYRSGQCAMMRSQNGASRRCKGATGQTTSGGRDATTRLERLSRALSPTDLRSSVIYGPDSDR
jgi:hypothetical protein